MPVYNCEPYIEDCLNSLLDSNILGNYEIICIDDGSTDKSGEILKKYAKDWPCIRVITQKNQGVASARNTGLKKALGKYITFVDADDFLLTGALGYLCGQANKFEADSLIFREFVKIGEYEHYRKEKLKFNAVEKKDRLITTYSTWGSLIKRSIIEKNEIYFDETMTYGEDTLFLFWVYHHVSFENQLVLDSPVYCYRQRKGSLMSSQQSTVRHMKDMLHMADVYSEYLKNNKDMTVEGIHNLQGRIRDAVAAALFDSLLQNEVDATLVLKELKKKGLYPYRFDWEIIKRNCNIPNIIMAVIGQPLLFNVFNKSGILKRIRKVKTDR